MDDNNMDALCEAFRRGLEIGSGAKKEPNPKGDSKKNEKGDSKSKLTLLPPFLIIK